MNKTITLLAIAGLSLANQQELLANDDDLKVNFGKLLEWGIQNHGTIRDGVKILKGRADDLDIFAGEDEDENLSVKGFAKEVLKKTVGEGAKWVGDHPEAVTKVFRFIGKHANDVDVFNGEHEDENLSVKGFAKEVLKKTVGESAKWVGDHPEAVTKVFRYIGTHANDVDVFNGEDEDENLVIGQIAKVVATQVAGQGAKWVGNHPEAVTKVFRYIGKHANDVDVFNGEDEDENLVIGQIAKVVATQVAGQGAKWVGNHPEAVTKVFRYIGKHANDVDVFNGEDEDENLVIGQIAKVVAKEVAGQGAKWVGNHPEAVTKVFRFIGKHADDVDDDVDVLEGEDWEADEDNLVTARDIAAMVAKRGLIRSVPQIAFDNDDMLYAGEDVEPTLIAF